MCVCACVNVYLYKLYHHFLLLYISIPVASPVIYPPSKSTIIVTVGSDLTLSCTSKCSPPDTFTWRKDSGPIVQSTSITTVTHTNSSAVFRADYSIDNVTTNNSGTYTCTVTNPIGSDSKIINVTVTGMCVCVVECYS